MFIGHLTRGFRYPEGTILDSSQRRKLIGTYTQVQVPVGATIVIQDDLECVQIVESFGSIRLERFFLKYYTLEEKQMMPIYTKIYDASGCHILLCKLGVETALNALDKYPDAEIHFVKEHLFDIVLNELYCIDGELHNLLRSNYDQPSWSEYTSNDTANYIADSNHIINYPWNSVDVATNMLKVFISEQNNKLIPTISNSIYDLSVQVGINNGEWATHPLYPWVDSIFGLELGYYNDIAFDNLTKLCLRNEMLDDVDIKRRLGYFKPKQFKQYDLIDGKEYEPVTEFSSELMLFCVWLHELPYNQVSFKYILPIRNQQIESFVGYSPYGNIKLSDDKLIVLNNIVNNIWGNGRILNIEVITNPRDEAFLTITETGGIVHKYYIDLFLTTLMSQAISRLPF